MPAGAWRAVVVVPDRWYIGLRGVVLGGDPRGVATLDSSGGLLVSIGRQKLDGGWHPSFTRRGGLIPRRAPVIGVSWSAMQGRGCCGQNVWYTLVMSFGAGMVRPVVVAQMPRYA